MMGNRLRQQVVETAIVAALGGSVADFEQRLGFHQAYYDKAFTFGIKVTSSDGTNDLMSYYPDTVKDWIRRNGGLTTEMKKIKNGNELWKIVDPCPEEW